MSYDFFGPGFLRGVPSFFNKFPSASRGTLAPGLGPRFLAVVDFAVWAAGFLFFDPAGRPRFLGAVFVSAGFEAAVFGLFLDPAGRPRFFGAEGFA